MSYNTISPAEAASRLERGEEFDFIDVREPEEHALARVEAARLLPLSRFQEWAASLDAEREIVVMCHHGIRSAQVCQFLAGQGFTKLHNLAGGIEGWSLEVDRGVPRY
ncbi:MAG: rhodanese-like domain-containing protein [Pyrinomonadaceae bacterium]